MPIRTFTLGCKVNQAESNVYQEIETDREVWIVNTCCLTSKAESESLALIKNLAQKKPQNVILAITGCLASIRHEISQIEGVDKVFPNTDRDLLYSWLKGDEELELTPLPSLLPRTRTRAFIKIQDGCSRRCKYCIVWRARGKPRSHTVHDILDSINSLVEQGIKECVLTGVCLGIFGVDHEGRHRLDDLIEGILTYTSLPRLRLSSIDIADISPRLVDLMAGSKRLCPHFHIPIQSGSMRIRRLMGRKGFNIDPIGFVRNLTERIPRLAIGFDLMVGFPTETEEDFSQTMKLVEELPIAYLHVFPYSPRPKTQAANMEQLDIRLKKTRAEALRSLGLKKKEEFLKSCIGQTFQVLIQVESKKYKGFCIGITDNYLKTLTPYTPNLGKILELKVVNIKNGILITDNVMEVIRGVNAT